MVSLAIEVTEFKAKPEVRLYLQPVQTTVAICEIKACGKDRSASTMHEIFIASIGNRVCNLVLFAYASRHDAVCQRAFRITI